MSGRVADRTLAVSVLGPLRVAVGDEELAVRPGQQKAVLALLAVAGGQPVRRAEFIEALWDGDPPPTAWNVVQTHVKRLRSILEPHRTSRSASAVIPRVADGYALAVEPGRVDLLQFRHLVGAARTVYRDGRSEAAFALLSRGLALWRGRPFADLPILADRELAETIEQERWAAVGLLVDVALLLGRSAEVVAQAEAAVAAVPLDERAAARLVRAYHASGRSADAFAAYRQTRHRLAEVLGVDPGPDLVAAHREALLPYAGAPVAAGRREAASAGWSHRPAELPADIADFVGRSSEIAQLTRALLPSRASNAIPVAAVVGMAGVGKSTLAIHVGHLLAGDFLDGQLYAALRGGSDRPADPARVLGRLLSALGVAGSAIPDGLDERAALYRTRLQGRRVLLVLDDAADAAQVHPLLPGTPSCAVLITSRDRLGTLAGAHRVALDVFTPADAATLLECMIGPRRHAEHPEAVAHILALCGWMPLAVRIAGARLAARTRWPLPQLRQRLLDERSRLDELVAGELGVRASLSLSYAALSPEARRALRLLSLLDTPDFCEWVLAALLDCSPRQVDAQLEVLLDTHLVVPGDGNATGAQRYRLHDLVRLYARGQAEAIDPPHVREAALTRVLGAWLTLAERADRLLNCRYVSRVSGPAPRWPVPAEVEGGLPDDPADWFDAERANLFAAVCQAADADAAGLAWNLADSAVGFYEMRDLHDDWRTSHEVALSACERARDDYGRAVMVRNLAYLASPAQRCDIHALEHRGKTAYALFEAAGDDRGRAEALVLRGEVHRSRGRSEQAARLLDAAGDLARRIGHRLGESVALNEAALAYREGGRDEEAADRYSRSLRLCAEHGNRRPRYAALRFLGVILAGRDELVPARAALREALGLAESMGSPVKQAMVLRELGVVECKLGEASGVEMLFMAYRLSRAACHRIEEAFALRSLGWADRFAGDPQRAVERLAGALALFQRAGLVFASAVTLKDLGSALVETGEITVGRRTWQVARRLFLALDNDAGIAQLDALEQGLGWWSSIG